MSENPSIDPEFTSFSPRGGARSPSAWGNVYEHEGGSRFSRACRSLGSAVRNRVQSLLGRFGRTENPEKDASIPVDEEAVTPLEASRERSSRISRILTTTSFCVAGLLSGIAISQTGQGSEFSSDVAHAVWLKETALDRELALAKNNAELGESVSFRDQEAKKLKSIQAQLVSENAELHKTVGKLEEKISVLEAEKSRRTQTLRKRAEQKQLVIDTKLKELLVLKGMKGVLKHEWIPSDVTDYRAYMKKQERSLRAIRAKIAELRAHQVPEASKTPVVSDATKEKAPNKPNRSSASPAEPWSESPGTGAQTRDTSVELPLRIADLSLADVRRIAQESRNKALWNDAKPSIRSPEMKDGSSDSGDSDPVPLLTNLGPPVSGTMLRKVYSDRIFRVIPSSKVEVLMPWQNRTFNVPITKQDMKSPTMKLAANTLPVGAFSVPNDSAGGWSAVITGIKVMSEVSARDVLSKLEWSPEITPENLTPERLREFTKRANANIALLDDKNPLKGTLLSLKEVKTKGQPAYRVFLKRGDKTGYFTLIPGQKSRNYKMVSSEAALMEWAGKKVQKWGGT